DYTDQALAVAQQGAAVVPGANEVSDIWYVVGMAFDDKRLDDKAIEAFDKAIESRPDNHKAKFQRGQAYFRKGDFTKAKKDLEEFAKAGGSAVEFAKQQASKMLLDIAAKSSMQQNTPAEAPAGGSGSKKMTPEQMLEDAKAKKAKGG
ncbi:MAG: tetratricopeptide repeat protein, partial [Deltaproteobacteria bacterium]|nr:tetratricopeptide repeat protein [Deltaproteobacteria bacterium]